MTLNKPIISCVLCTYNGEKYVDSCLKSICEQSRTPDEIILVDDGSTDFTVDRIKETLHNYQVPYKLTLNEFNLGVNQNHQKALLQCSGDIIIIADQDDIWHPDKVLRLTSYFNTASPLIVFSNAQLIDSEGADFIYKNTSTLWERHSYSPGRDNDLKKKILQNNVVTGSTMAISKELLDIVLPLPENEQPLYDEWIVNIAVNLPDINIIPCEEILGQYRIHDDQYTSQLYMTEAGSKGLFNKPLYSSMIELRYSSLYRIIERLKSFNIDFEYKEYGEALNFWELRHTNLKNTSISTLTRLIGLFLTGRYRYYTSYPFKTFAKDMLYHL